MIGIIAMMLTGGAGAALVQAILDHGGVRTAPVLSFTSALLTSSAVVLTFAALGGAL